MLRNSLALILILFVALPAHTQRNYPPELSGFEVEIYKTISDVELNIYRVGEIDQANLKPAIVFFFGGGWRGGTPQQFEHQAKYLASRGMIAFIADYRVASRHQVTADECVRDAKAAVRWIRTNAERLGVDPNSIVASGGSAGGHLAASTGVVPGFEDNSDPISSQPNALVLFNPALVLAPYEGVPMPGDRIEDLLKRLGVKNEDISPIHHVQPGAPPAIIFHGDADSTVPHLTVQRFTEVMIEHGNICELKTYEGAGHGFFNAGRNGNKNFRDTMRQADAFLVKHGFLKGPATIDEYPI